MIVYIDYESDSGKITSVTHENQGEKYTEVEIEGNSFLEVFNYKYVDGVLVELTPEEKEEFYPTQKDEKAEQEASLQSMMAASARASFLADLPDEKAVMFTLCYDSWKTDTAYKVGDRVKWDGKLWKCRQAHTSQENWKPCIETASLWEVINVENAGTLDDPIPYDQTMTVYNGKYYLEEGIIYKCIRDSGQPLYATCASLVGNYFEVTA